MPWETKFDINNAIDSATAIFWAKGYKATSLADLLQAMDINKGSFYNTFGSKKALFTKALEKYDQEHRRRLLSNLRELENPVKAITQLFHFSMNESSKDPDKKGCFIVNTAMDSITQALREVESFFKEQIELGIKLGQIPTEKNSSYIAKSLLTLAVGWRVLSRGIYDESDMNAIKKQVTTLIS